MDLGVVNEICINVRSEGDMYKSIFSRRMLNEKESNFICNYFGVDDGLDK